MVPERTHARANPARGLALIATAVVVGFFLLRNGWDQNAPDVADAATEAGPGAEGGEAPPPAGEDPAATSTTLRPADQVTVQVLNASGVSGAAAGLTDQIAQSGYVTVDPDNAPPPTREVTAVVFIDGFQGEGANLATQIGAPPDQVIPLANAPGVNPGQAQLLVLLGTDKAQGG